MDLVPKIRFGWRSRAPVEPIARQLEDELMRVKLQLRTTIEQYELQHEELKASNEELQAMNEELRSAGEELETSKEELQSINEELTHRQPGAEDEDRGDYEANNDTAEPHGLDRNRDDLRRSDTAHQALHAARASDLQSHPGRFRPTALDITTSAPLCRAGARYSAGARTLSTGSSAKCTQPTAAGTIARMLPYRTAEDRIDGVVLTFVDITERKRCGGGAARE